MRRLLCGLALLLSLTARADELGVQGHRRISLRLHEGEMARVQIDQTKIDVVISVRQVTRGIAYEVSNPYDNAVPEEVFVVADRDDEEWQLDVSPRGSTTSGTYTAAIERRPATADDRKRAGADATYWRLAELLEKHVPEARKRLDSVLADARAVVTAYRELGDGRREAEALLLVAAALSAGPDPAAAPPVYDEALAATRAAGFALLVPHILDLIASNCERTKPQEAVNLWMEALAEARRVGSKLITARVLNHLGVLNRDVDPRLAIEYFEQAFAIWTETGDRQRLAYGYHNVAGAYRSLAQHDKAIAAIRHALALFRELGDEFYEANTLASLGIFLNYAGRREEAVQAFEEALALARWRGFQSPTVTTLIAYAYLRASCDEWIEARRLLDEAEVVAKEVGGLEIVINNRAMVDLRGGHPERALPQLQRVVDQAEQRWATIRGGSLQTKFFAHTRYQYDALVDALVQLDRKDDAFAVAERSRSRALLSLLSQVHADVRTGAPAELVAHARALEKQLAAVPLQPDDAARREAGRITTELEQVEGEIRRALPGYGNLTQAGPPTIAHVQSLLDDDTLLLYYNLSFNNEVRHGFLWALTPHDAQLVLLPAVEQLDPQVRAVMAQLTRRGDERNLTRVSAMPIHRDATEYWRAAARLSQTVLGPVRDRLHAAKRLVIVADGMLQYIPFAALPMPDGSEAVPLADTHEVIYVPSASVLSLLRSQGASRAAAPKTLALFGDPVFSTTDARVRATKQVAAPGSAELTRAAADVALTRDGVIPRLEFTAAEATSIAAIVPTAQRHIYTGFDATKHAALDAELRRYRILHFATHGIIDDTHPELSGLLLSLYDRDGRPMDGFLRLSDIYEMRLGADLVVLSGCRTALGKEVRSEGMVGLARGFLYAGARKLVVTLWNIDDRATSELMSRFYRGMLKEKRAPADALRRAQAAIRRDPRWSHPYYWAAFTYTGDWR